MSPEEIKAVKHYTNKLQLLLLKYDNVKSSNIKKDISNEIKNILQSYKISGGLNGMTSQLCRVVNISWGKEQSEK